MKTRQFNNFLNEVKEKDVFLIEGIQKAYNILFESTEEIVQQVKEKVGSDDEETWEELLEEPEKLEKAEIVEKSPKEKFMDFIKSDRTVEELTSEEEEAFKQR